MKRIIITILVGAILTGCGGKKPLPADRLHQVAGEFSFITPDGWYRAKLAGIDFIIVSTDPEFGVQPNIFVDFVEPSSNVTDVLKRLIETNQAGRRAYAVIQQEDFVTESGLVGVKITATRETKDGLPLAALHYLFQDADRVIVITCSCADPVKQKFAPIFNATMKSLKSDRVSQPPG